MKKTVSIKTNFAGSFGVHAPEIIKKWFKGTANATVDGTVVVESSYDLSIEELKELFGEEKESISVGSKYLQESLKKDCDALMQSIKTSTFQFQEMKHQLNMQIQKDDAEEQKLREAITAERQQREEEREQQRKEKEAAKKKAKK